MTTLLFFDDYYLNRWENLQRRVGQPELEPEATFIDPAHGLASGYPTVFRTEAGQWRCLYQGKSISHMPAKISFPLIAESDDGIHWEIPDLTEKVPLPDRAFPNQVMSMDRFGQWDHYFDERADDPQERLKGLVTTKFGALLYTSPDGLKWREVEGVEWRPGSPDPPSMAFWNELRQSYVIMARPGRNPHPRRLAVSETKDWRTFGESELTLRADALDLPLTELYGNPAFPYEEMFVGFVWVYNTVPYRANDPTTHRKYYGGKTYGQLSYSYNGWHFHRSLRDPFIPNAPTGELGAGIMRPMSMIIDDDHCIRIYSSASKLEHGYHIQGSDLGGHVMHRLRLDGFMYLESAGGPGILGTRPLFWRGGALRLNLQSAHDARVQVTDVQGQTIEGYGFEDCQPFVGDELFWEPRWQNDIRMADLSNRLLRLEISLENARLFAIRGDLFAPSSREVRRYLETGEEPKPVPGG